MKSTLSILFLLFCCVTNLLAQAPADRQFIRTDARIVALTRVRVIDGTGAAPKEDQTIIISDGKIQSVEPGTAAKIPANAADAGSQWLPKTESVTILRS